MQNVSVIPDNAQGRLNQVEQRLCQKHEIF